MNRPSAAAPLPPRSIKKRFERFELLTGWYGPERAAVEMAAHTCQPQAISAALDQLLASTRNQDNGALVRLRAEWPRIVGAGFARFTAPTALRDGELTLTVRHSALLVELRSSLDIFQQAIDREIGAGVCRSIRLVTGSLE